MNDTNPGLNSLPLESVRVVELCEIAAGPFCGLLLADMGADVIKVERPAGDAMRSWPPLSDGYSENFASINRNKRSVVLDIKSTEGLQSARQLIQASDVVIENFRPGVMQRLGIDYRAMSAVNPGLIYCSISAFGQTGPRATQGGFDLTMQAMAGVMSVTGDKGAAPVKCGVPLCDFVSGLYGAFSVAAALKERENTGVGKHIDVSMLGATLGIAALQTSEYFGTGIDPQKLGSAHPRNAPYQAFSAADGHFGMAAGNNNLWCLVCDVIEREDLKEHPDYLTPSHRAANQTDLRDILEAVFVTRPVQHWLDVFSSAGVPCSPINSYSEALADPQVDFMGWVQPMTLANGVETKTFGAPVRFDDKTVPVRRRPPSLGEHTEEVLQELAQR